jgi:hypothetical protein
MAQIAIPLVIAGVLYLASNERKENFDVKEEREFDKNIQYKKTKQKEDITVLNNVEKSSININDKGVYSQYQDKYMKPAPKTGEFVSLTGETTQGFSHNNMNAFYNNKSNGLYSQPNFNNMNENRLDTYTGTGTFSIEKEEISSLFKPQENMQNVYGTQNQSDFLQSRVNESLRHANTKPWEEVKEAPGTTGFNTAVENRDKWMPKKVNDLRVATNPKSNYELNYVAPAFKMGDHAQMGKVIQKGPEKYHVNGTNGMGSAQGMLKPTQMSEQMLTDENRELTSKGSTQGAPVIVNNTTNNMSEQGSSMNFASATSTNPNDSVRDYKRNNARLFDAA